MCAHLWQVGRRRVQRKRGGAIRGKCSPTCIHAEKLREREESERAREERARARESEGERERERASARARAREREAGHRHRHRHRHRHKCRTGRSWVRCQQVALRRRTPCLIFRAAPATPALSHTQAPDSPSRRWRCLASIETTPLPACSCA